MSANEINQPPTGDSLPPIPEDVMRKAEERLRRRTEQRNETKRKIVDKEFKNIDTPARLRARVNRVLGDPAATQEASRNMETGSTLESLGPGGSSDQDVLLERIIGGENFIGVRFFDLGQRAARAIVRIDIRTPEGKSGSGTGSLVSKRLLLTNNHVLQNSEWARRSKAVFDFEDDFENKPRPTVIFELDPDAFFYTNPEFDFTLVAVREMSLQPAGVKLSAYSYNPLDPAEGKIAVGEPINIIQHPSGMHKQVVLQENRLLDLPDDSPGWLHYESDTMPGSSGAPLFNNRWEMVGLHHAGWPKRDEQGRILTVKDELWTKDMGELAIKWLGNEGARVTKILSVVEKARANMPPESQALIAELLSPPKSGSVVLPPLPETEAGQSASVEDASKSSLTAKGQSLVSHSPGKNTGASSAGSGGVTFTVPLNITVSVGASASSTPALPASSALPRPIPPVTAPDDQIETDKGEALRDHRESSTRPYFDAVLDKDKRENYYRELDLANISDPNQLFDALSGLLSRTHINRLAYRPAHHLYPWVDLQPDRKLRSLYTNDVYEPQQLIEESFAVEAEFEARLESLLLDDGGEGALPLLEAGPAYNCEHVVPRSWFKGPLFGVAEGDLHHLFTCHVQCNSFRGNVPFWEFPDFQETVMSGCGRREENKFEPSHGKGAAARAMMYFLLRYPRLIDDNVSELQANRLSILNVWHQQEGVSDYERHRNSSIQDKQGNRNPLIDFPELVVRLNFARGLMSS